MKRLLAATIALLALAGCDRMLMPPEPTTYAPWEEGLTLGYENPSLDGPRREQERFQVRIKESLPQAGGRLVTETNTTATGQIEMVYFQKDGGVSLGNEEGRLRVLPKGFPDRVSRWEDRGIMHWVVGRAWVQLPGVRLADPAGATGVWVEAMPINGEGQRRRTLYLPNVGEAETLLWQGGRWVPVFRLVTRGFTDVAAKVNP